MARCSRGCCDSQAEHYRSIAVAPKMNEVGRPKQTDAALGYDLAAYRAMRRQGLQPPRIDGSYDLARRATSEAEIRLGQVISDRDPARKRKGTKLMENSLEIADHGMTGRKPDLTGKRVPMKVRR